MPINIEKLSYSYFSGGSHVRALRGVSLDMGARDYLGIAGAHGSGKTTLAMLMCGLLKPESGRVLINGEDINGPRYDSSSLRRRIAMLFTRPEQQLFESTVERDVAFALGSMGLGKEEKREKVRAAIERVGLDYDSVRSASPRTLPLYRQRLVALAGLLVFSPDILVLDEPLSDLDAVQRRSFLDLIDSLNASGTSIVLLTTDTKALAEHARGVAVLKDGQLVRTDWAGEAFVDYFELLNNSLDVPDVRRAVQLLRQRGVDMPENVVRYEEFIDRLKIIMWRKKI